MFLGPTPKFMNYIKEVNRNMVASETRINSESRKRGQYLVEVPVELFLENDILSFVLWSWNFFFGPAERIVPPHSSRLLSTLLCIFPAWL